MCGSLYYWPCEAFSFKPWQRVILDPDAMLSLRRKLKIRQITDNWRKNVLAGLLPFFQIQSLKEVNRATEWRHAPSTEHQWDLLSENICTVLNGERQISFCCRSNCAVNLKYDVCQFKGSFCKSRKSHVVQ